MDRRVDDRFSLTFRTMMAPWTQDCVYFIVLTLSEAGIAVEPDPLKRGLGFEEQWFTPWSEVMSLQHVRPPEPIVRVEFPTSSGQTAIRDIRIPPVKDGPFAGCSGPHLVEAILSAFQETHRPPSVAQVLRVLPEVHEGGRPGSP
jgi:hypothetical protein